MALAQKSRPQFAVLQRREESARLNGVAIRSERLPSLIAYADYGALVGGACFMSVSTSAMVIAMPFTTAAGLGTGP